MPSYMTIVVLALAASNVPAVLSVPVHSSTREVREQSLSRREEPPESSRPLMPGNSVLPANPPTQPGKGPEAEPPKKAMSMGKQLALNFAVGIASSLFAAAIFQDMTYAFKSAPATSSTTSTSTTSSANQAENAQYNSYKSTYPSGSTSTPQYGQYPNQQRAVDHDGKRADFFEAKARSMSDNNRRATSASHLELLTRADLGEAHKLSTTRVLDELD